MPSHSLPLYPISAVLDSLQQSLAQGHVVLRSPTGSGKTTIAPLALLHQGWLSGKKIYMLEPRRVAARAAAYRMSSLLGEKVGQTVGYITRYSKSVSEKTRIFVVTEGVFLKTIQKDQELSNVGLVIFDEYHERSLIADLCLALCLDLATLREDLRLLVMSATLDSEKLAQLLGNASVIESEGKSFPVTVMYRPSLNPRAQLSSTVANAISYALEHHQGDILTFLPGIGEIKAVERELASLAELCQILPLYGDLPVELQDKVLAPKEDQQRRVILATPVAETSLTVDGVRCIVDSGLYKHPVYDPKSGLTSLVTSKISQASAEQRRGRAGRQTSGVCIRLWSEATHHGLLSFTPPEICHADLTRVVLELAHWGVADPNQLPWLNPPSKGAWNKSVVLLESLKGLNDKGGITDVGKNLLKLALHPRLSYMILQAQKLGLGLTACYLAGILSERDIFQGSDKGSDIRDRISALIAFRQPIATHRAQHQLNRQVCKQIVQHVDRWQRELGINKNEKIVIDDVGTLLCYSYPDRIGIQRSKEKCSYQLATGRQVRIAEHDPINTAQLIVAPQVESRGGQGKVFLASQLTMHDIENYHPHLVSTKDITQWNDGELAVQARRESYVGVARLSSSAIPLQDKERALELLMKGIQQGGSDLLPWTKQSRELQARLQTLHLHDPKNWQECTDEAIVKDVTWLEPFCYGLSKIQQLRNIDLQTPLISQLPYNKQQELQSLAPTHFTVPSGSKVRITYSMSGEPVLAVRLQEVFGMQQTPAICRGNLPITLHLLSPARRPMQITKDLHSFWQRTYPEIKKELAGRYPKHHWPNNPLEAQATAGTKKRGRQK